MITSPDIIGQLVQIRKERSAAQQILTLWRQLEQFEVVVPEIKDHEDRILKALATRDKDALKVILDTYTPLYRHRKAGRTSQANPLDDEHTYLLNKGNPNAVRQSE